MFAWTGCQRLVGVCCHRGRGWVQDAVVGIDWSRVDFSKARTRPLERQLSWSFCVCLQLSLPVLVAMAFFISSYFVDSNSASGIAGNAKAIYTLETRKVRWGACSACAVGYCALRAASTHANTHTNTSTQDRTRGENTHTRTQTHT